MGKVESARAIFSPPQSASLATGAYAPASASLSTIAQQAQKYTGATGAAIALKEGQLMVCHASVGTSAPDVGIALRLDGTLAGLCVQSGQIMQCHDAEADSRVDAAAARHLGARAMVITPIRLREAVVGILAVYSPIAHSFKERHIVILKTMSEVITEILAGTSAEDLAATAPTRTAPVKQTAPIPERKPAVSVKAVPGPRSEKTGLNVPASSSVPLVVTPLKPNPEPMAPVARSPRSSVGPMPLAEALDRSSRLDAMASIPRQATTQPTDFNATIFRGMPRESIWKRLLPVAAVLLVAIVAGGFWIFRGQTRAQTHQPVADVAPASVMAPAPEPVAETMTVTAPVEPVTPAPIAHETRQISEPSRAREKAVETTIFAAPTEPSPTAMRVAPDLPASNLGSRSRAPESAQDASDEPPAVSLGESGKLAQVPAAPQATPVLAQAPKSSHVIPSQVIRRVAPLYPEMARRSGIQGTVVLTATVTKEGKLRDVRVVRGNPVFHASAIAAVQQWLYKPGYLNGEPVETTTEVTLTFSVPK